MRDISSIIFWAIIIIVLFLCAKKAGENFEIKQQEEKIQFSEENRQYAKSYIEEKLLCKICNDNPDIQEKLENNETPYIVVVDAKILPENSDIVNITYFERMDLIDINICSDVIYNYKCEEMSIKEIAEDETIVKLLRNNLQ
jgi:hypothetical protein